MKKEIKRDKNTTVIMPDEVLAPSIDDPETLELNLDRTKKYVKRMLDRPMAEVWTELNNQMMVILLSMREASIKWLEIWTNSNDASKREEAKHHFVALTREAANVAAQRQELAKAFGLDVSGEIAPESEAGESKLPVLFEQKPMSHEDFMARFVPNAPKPVLGDMRTLSVTVNEGEKK